MSIEKRLADLEERFARAAEDAPDQVTEAELRATPDGLRILDRLAELTAGDDRFAADTALTTDERLHILYDLPGGREVLRELAKLQTDVLRYRRYASATAHPAPFELWRQL